MEYTSRADREHRAYDLASIANTNAHIATLITTEREQIQGPRLGDFIRMKDGTTRRFTYNWGDGIQVESVIDGRVTRGSFFIFANGRCSYSGGLDSPVPIERIRYDGGSEQGEFWFFSRNRAEASNAVYVSMPCRTYMEV